MPGIILVFFHEYNFDSFILALKINVCVISESRSFLLNARTCMTSYTFHNLNTLPRI